MKMVGRNMKGIFLVDNPENINQVYNDSEKKRLEELGVDIKNIYTKERLNSIDTNKVEFVFSTWNMPKFTKEEIKIIFPNLKYIFYAAGTVKYFAEPFLELGIEVFSADSINAISVAEYTYAQILMANKGYFQAERFYRKRKYKKARNIALRHKGNYQSVIGIIGAGNIGKKVIKYLANKSHEYRILVNDIMLSQSEAYEMGCELVSLGDLFKESDVISNHLPDIDSTRNIINIELMSNMKKNATLINTGRGRQIVEKDLFTVLKKRKDLTAVLDVVSHEPPLPFSKFYSLPNVFLSPHIAGSIGNENFRMGEYMLNLYERILNNEQCKSVSKSEIYKMT